MRENVNFFKTGAQLLYHIVQYTLWKNKGRGRNKSQASRSVDVCTQNINFTLQFEEGLFFLQVFCKTILFSLPSDKEEMIGSAFVSLQYRHLKSE